MKNIYKLLIINIVLLGAPLLLHSDECDWLETDNSTSFTLDRLLNAKCGFDYANALNYAITHSGEHHWFYRGGGTPKILKKILQVEGIETLL